MKQAGHTCSMLLQPARESVEVCMLNNLNSISSSSLLQVPAHSTLQMQPNPTFQSTAVGGPLHVRTLGPVSREVPRMSVVCMSD